MSVHRLPPRDEPFDPRQAALAHASAAAMLAEQGPQSLGEPDPRGTARIMGEFANAVTCGLVYVGEQIGRLQRADAGPALRPAPSEVVPAQLADALGELDAEVRELEDDCIAAPTMPRLFEAAQKVRSARSAFEQKAGAVQWARSVGRDVVLRDGEVAEPQSPLVGAQVVGWDSDDGGGVLVRVSTGATYRIQVGMPFEIPARVDWSELDETGWREFLRDQAAQIPDGVRAAAEELLAQFEHDSTAGWTLAGEHVTADVSGPLTSLADWLNQLSNVREEVADGGAGE